MDRKKLKKEYARLVAESIKENIEPKDIDYINNGVDINAIDEEIDEDLVAFI